MCFSMGSFLLGFSLLICALNTRESLFIGRDFSELSRKLSHLFALARYMGTQVGHPGFRSFFGIIIASDMCTQGVHLGFGRWALLLTVRSLDAYVITFLLVCCVVSRFLLVLLYIVIVYPPCLCLAESFITGVL